MITKGERAELKSVVKQQFKVLRSEVDQRQAEMYADVEEQIANRYSDNDTTWRGVKHEVQEAVSECNRRINDALYKAGYEARGSSERQWVSEPLIQQPRQERDELRRVAQTRIIEQVKGAKMRLDREEADLLRTLAVGAIESEEAREFLSAIPSVSELVPTARLAELAASLRTESFDD